MFQTIDQIIEHYSKKEDKQLQTADLNQVSSCCHRPIVVSQRMEYPLGGTTWGQAYKVDLCECCGKEAEPVNECGICGVVGCENECEEATV